MKAPAEEYISLLRIAALFAAGFFVLAHLLQARSVLDLCYRAAIAGACLALGFLLGYVVGAAE